MSGEEADWLGYTFEERSDFLKERWDSAAKQGKPRPEARKLWEQLSLELEFSGKPLAELEGIALYGLRWMETKNPFYIDAAILLCREHGIDPPPSLMQLLAEVAAIRFQGLEKGGTAKKIRNEGIQGEALRIICCLHIAGLPLQEAASKAARYIDDLKLGKSFKASTLEREYSTVFRGGEPNLEAEVRDGWMRMSEADRQEWARLTQEMPDANDDLMGSRR